MNSLTESSEVLPTWAPAAIQLLTPALGIMARPVVINNLKRVCAAPAAPTSDEMTALLAKVRHGILTFATSAKADLLVEQLRLLMLRGS